MHEIYAANGRLSITDVGVRVTADEAAILVGGTRYVLPLAGASFQQLLDEAALADEVAAAWHTLAQGLRAAAGGIPAAADPDQSPDEPMRPTAPPAPAGPGGEADADPAPTLIDSLVDPPAETGGEPDHTGLADLFARTQTAAADPDGWWSE